MLEIVICEDNIEYLRHLSTMVNKILTEIKITGHIVCQALTPADVDEFLKNGRANVFLLDINFDCHAEGLTLASRIREYDSSSYIIFVSEHPEYVFSSFKVHPFEFLKKPASKDDIKNCIYSVYLDFIIKTGGVGDDKKITIKSGSVTYLLKKSEIVLIERLMSKTIIHTPNKQISCYNSLEFFEKLLESDGNFIRCHKSYIANKQFIIEIRHTQKEIILSTGHKCYIGKKYKERV